MANDKDIAQHYLHGNLTGAIEEGLTKLGKTKQTATVEDLGPVDEFHIGGATSYQRTTRPTKSI